MPVSEDKTPMSIRLMRQGVIRPWGPMPPPPPGHTWESLMDQAIRAARASLASDCKEVPVGAVIAAPDGTILAEASNAVIRPHDPTGHAEIRALRAAAKASGNYRLSGCVMAVTLEPCLMCAGALVHARLAGVVYGAADMRAGAVISCLEGLDLHCHNHRVWHYGGVRSAECARLLHAFFTERRTESRPNG